MGVIGIDADRLNRVSSITGPVADLNLGISVPSDRSAEHIARVRRGKERICLGGWTCLTQGQQFGILFIVVVVSVSLILAMAYYYRSRKNQGWTDNNEDIIPMRLFQRKMPKKNLRHTPPLVSRHTSYGLPTIPGIPPPLYNVMVVLYQRTVRSYIQGPNPIILPARPMPVAQPPLTPMRRNQGAAAYSIHCQPICPPIQPQVELPIPQQHEAHLEVATQMPTPLQSRHETQYHACGTTPGTTSLEKRFSQLSHLPSDRVETISTSRPQSRDSLRERRQSHESNVSVISTEVVRMKHGHERQPITNHDVATSPASNMATLYSDDFLLHQTEQVREDTRVQADVQETPGIETKGAQTRGIYWVGEFGRFRDNSSSDLPDGWSCRGRQPSSCIKIQDRWLSGHDTRRRQGSRRYKGTPGHKMMRMLVTTLVGIMRGKSERGRKWNDGDGGNVRATRLERESRRRIQETSRFWDAVVRDDSMDSGTEKGLGPVPLEPVHQGGGQYEPHRLNRKSSAHIFVSSEEASDRRLDTGHGD